MTSGSRRPVNVSVDAEVLDKARGMGVNLSRAAEDGIARAILREENRRWIEENADVIKSSNEYVEKYGLPLSRYRQF